MKCALITTTINIPEVLKLYRACDPDVRFFVAGDKKTPQAAYDLCDAIPNCVAGRETSQIGWKCSDLIGWNTISRRNIALLEALKWGAEVIVTVDDDNLCLDQNYFIWMRSALAHEFNGIAVSGYGGWFDVGQLLDPVAPHRGFPDVISAYQCRPVTGARVGVAAGICLGDPDIAAITRLANRPKPLDVHRVSELLRAGIVVHPGTKTVFNSQNTAFIRELAPCFLMCPQFGRYDDIIASVVCQRTMREHDLHVHFGQPFVWQQRNPHDLLKDLAAETWGMNHIVQIASALDTLVLPESGDVTESVRFIYGKLGEIGMVPAGVSELAQAWCDDLEKIL